MNQAVFKQIAEIIRTEAEGEPKPQSGARGVLLHQLVRALIPFIARIVGAEHRRRLLRLGRDAEREIAFGQAVERLGGVAGRLIFVDDLAKADRRGEPVRAALIETADFHFLAREMILHQIRSEEHTSELQSLMRISYAVFCLKKKTNKTHLHNREHKHK